MKGASSVDKLDAALAAHRLTPAAAAVDQAYALRGDPRLPRSFRTTGQLSQGDAERALREVIAAYGSLPKSARSKVRALLGYPVPPRRRAVAATGSTSGNGWEAVSSSEARVWWNPKSAYAAADRAMARAILEQLTSIVWPKETGLMGRKPISDEGLPGDMGDGRLDIVLAPSPGIPTGLTIPFGPTCAKGPRWIQLSDRSYERVVLAHEFFHVLVAAFDHQDCNDDAWWDEGTARWAETYVYGVPDKIFDDEAKEYLEYGFDQELPRANYRSALFAFDIAKLAGPEVIRRTWEGAGSQRIGNAIDGALAPQGGLAQVWPDFALQLTNTADGYRHLKEWLGYDRSSLEPLIQPSPTDAPFSPRTLPERFENYGLQPLSALMFDARVNSPETRSWAFFNPWMESGKSPPPGLNIKALIHTPDGWSVEDWTNRPSRFFCRQNSSERLDRAIVVFTSTVPYQPVIRAPDGDQPEIVSSTAGCRGYNGTVTGSTHSQSEGGTSDETWSAHIHFVPSAAPVETAEGDSVGFALEPTSLSFGGLSGSIGICSISAGAMPVALGPDSAEMTAVTLAPSWSGFDPSPPVYGGSSIALHSVVPGTLKCPEEPEEETEDTVLNPPWFVTADPALGTSNAALRAIPSGGHLTGTQTFSGEPDSTTTVNWDLAPDPDG